MEWNGENAFNMLMVLGECQQNHSAAAREYALRFPDRPHPSRKVFERLAARVKSGKLLPTHNKNEEIARPARQDEASINVLAAIALNPSDSVRNISRDSGIEKSTVQRILHDRHFHPFKISLHQELSEQDKVNRLNFCHWARERLAQDASYFKRVLWSDEATFKSNGQVNRHNCHYYASVNPHWVREVDNQHVWSINVWCGIVGNHVIGPYFFDGHLNGDMYLAFLQNDLEDLMEDVPLNIRAALIFQQDGAPPHWARRVRDYLDVIFPMRWIGRGSPFRLWPARSPDLTPLDFYLWGKIKDAVYFDRPRDPEDMKQRIRNVCASITPAELAAVHLDFKRRLRRCINQNGGIFEHLKKTNN